MTANAQPLEVAGLDGGEPGARAGTFSPEPDVTRVEVPLGRRVMVVSDLLLTPEPTSTTSAVTTEVARALDTWDGPGILIIAGNLFDLSGSTSPLSQVQRSLEAHPALNQALTRFLTIDERRVIRQTGTHEPGYDTDPDMLSAMAAKGVEPAGAVDLYLHTATGVRVVRVEPGEHAYAAGCSGPETEFDPAADAKPGVIGPSSAGRGWRSLVAQSNREAPWLIGLNRLSDPSALSRFVVSRTLYRRLGRYAWWLLVPFVVAGLLRVAVTPWVMDHLGSGLPASAIRHAHQADLGDQIVIALLVALVVLGVLALVLGLLSRRMWSILGGGALEEVQAQAAANDAARDAGRRLVGRGYAGLITAATFQSELTHLGVGFYANVGATAEVVDEHRGALGLPPDLPAQPAGQLGRARDRRRAACSYVAGQQRAPVAQRPRAVDHPGPRGPEPPSVAGGVLPDGRIVASRRPTSTRPIGGPGGCDDGRRPASCWPASSTSSMPSHHRCEAGSTWYSSSFRSGPARPQGR